jgi:aspartate aminotransferase/aminotransferase
MRISDRARNVNPSGIRRVFDLASQLENPIDFSIGQPDFDVPEPIKEAAIEAIRKGFNRYTATQGIAALNEAILDSVESRCQVRPESSLITIGVAGGLTLGLLALLDADDQALIPDPYFICYRNLAEMLSLPPAYYDLYPDFRITEERLEAGMTEEVRVLVVNSPGNPTGRVLDEAELDAVVAFARRHDLVVLSDEIYDLFSFDAPAPSLFGRYDKVVLLGGFSKTYGMPGWRLGYAVGPRELIDTMRTLQQFSYVCPPTPLQHAVVGASKVDMSPYVRAYRIKRDLVVSKLAGHFELVRPEGAFYAFPEVPGGISAMAFAERALERNLLVVPGSAFSRRDTHLRLSFALADDVLGEGLDLLRALASQISEAGAGSG